MFLRFVLDRAARGLKPIVPTRDLQTFSFDNAPRRQWFGYHMVLSVLKMESETKVLNALTQDIARHGGDNFARLRSVAMLTDRLKLYERIVRYLERLASASSQFQMTDNEIAAMRALDRTFLKYRRVVSETKAMVLDAYTKRRDNVDVSDTPTTPLSSELIDDSTLR